MIAVMYLTGSLGLFLYGMKIMSEGIAQACLLYTSDAAAEL